VKLALLKGNRFNPWHMQPFTRMGDDTQVSAFRAESEIQQYFAERDDGSAVFEEERIYFNYEVGGALGYFLWKVRNRLTSHPPYIMPFHDRLETFDLIQTWELFTDWSAQAMEAKERYGVPVSVMVWDNIAYNMENTPERRAIKNRVAEGADLFLVHTERSRRILNLEGIDDERIVQVNPGVDLDVFAPGPPDRKGLEMDADEFMILFVGWLLPRKGIDFLLIALRQLADDPALKNKSLRLHIVGSGPGRDRVEALIDRAGLKRRCTLAGSVPYDKMPALYRAADVFVLPSIATDTWQEQFGMSLIEAMACGRPIITTASGAIPEIVGDAARLCQPNDFLSLYEALKDLILDDALRDNLAQQARQRAEQHFNVTDAAQALSAAYKEILKD
jgi:glycosyltransferase involved in cell wall biosynthesis